MTTKNAAPHMKDGVCIHMDRFDYSAGVASTEASGVAVGFTVAFGVAVAFPFGVALVDAVGLTDGDGDAVRCTSLFSSCAARRLTLRAFIAKKRSFSTKGGRYMPLLPNVIIYLRDGYGMRPATAVSLV